MDVGNIGSLTFPLLDMALDTEICLVLLRICRMVFEDQIGGMSKVTDRMKLFMRILLYPIYFTPLFPTSAIR